MKPKILVVDDEPDAVELIEFNLKANGYDVATAADGEEALEKARALLPNLIILDIMLPEVDGMEVCKILRRDQRTSGIPIIMLTAKAAEIDRVLGFELGADDYVTKPFSPRELVLRVKRLLRTGAVTEEKGDHVVWKELSIDVPRHMVSIKGKSVDLTATEFKLLTVLAQWTRTCGAFARSSASRRNISIPFAESATASSKNSVNDLRTEFLPCGRR